MKKEIGMWVDHRRAVIVLLENNKETVQIILSNMESNTRFSSSSHPGTANDDKAATAEDIRDRQNDLHRRKYFAEIAYKIRETDSILIFGPGEAKSEFATFLKKENFGGKINAVEPADKMTDRQISAKVHDFYIHA